MDKKLCLTDEQYKKLLFKVKEIVDVKGFGYSCEDSTMVGNKHTISNCGFCNDEFVDKDMALFPDEYPQRKTMKDRLDHHKCPFDMRIRNKYSYSYGCFYHCCLFQHKRYRGKSITTIELRELVDKRIMEIKK